MLLLLVLIMLVTATFSVVLLLVFVAFKMLLLLVSAVFSILLLLVTATSRILLPSVSAFFMIIFVRLSTISGLSLSLNHQVFNSLIEIFPSPSVSYKSNVISHTRRGNIDFLRSWQTYYRLRLQFSIMTHCRQNSHNCLIPMYYYVVRTVDVYIPFIDIDVQILEVVDTLTYLGSTISSSLSLKEEVNIRLSYSGQDRTRVWDNNHVTETTKLRDSQTCYLSTLLYDCETWTTYAS